MKNLKLIVISLLCAGMIATLPSCGKEEPGSLIDTDKSEFENLINEANKPSEDKVSAEEISKIEYKDYVAVLENSYGTTKVTVNADVEVPATDKFSVYSVKQKRFTQEFADRVRTALMGGQKVYDGSSIDALKDIDYYVKSINNTGSNALKEIYRGEMDVLLKGFGFSSENVSVQSFVTDGKLKKVSDIFASNPYYKREYGLYPDGDLLRLTTDGSDGTYAFLEVLNSSNYSNKLEFVSNKLYYNDLLHPTINEETLDKYFGSVDNIKKDTDNKTKPDGLSTHVIDTKGRSYVPVPGETCSITEEQAIKKAKDFLTEIGLTDFECYKNKVSKTELFTYSDLSMYRTSHELEFRRKLDGVFLTQSSGDKNNLSFSGPESATFGKKFWYGERIVFRINDDGIVYFMYLSPIEVTETVSENVKIKEFEEVKSIFENLIITSKGDLVRDITGVRLSYSRVSEGTSNYETGLIVPMWDFYGPTGSMYAISAIDGTVIYPANGYY